MLVKQERRKSPISLFMCTIIDYRMAQASIDLQQEISTLNLEEDAEMVNPVAIQTSPTSPTHEAQVTIEVGTSNGVYYGQYTPQTPLTNEELMSEFVSPSIYLRRGFIVQFVNNNANCSPTVIGGIRTNETDVRKIPHYLSVNKTTIKRLACSTLVRHLNSTQCGVATLEFLNEEDYGMSFSLASLSLRGSTLNPSRRNEAPIFYCHLPGFTDPCYIGQTIEGAVDSAHVVNCYIHILPANLRRNAILRKSQEAAVEAESIQTIPAAHSGPTPGSSRQATPVDYSIKPVDYSNKQNKTNHPKTAPRMKPYQTNKRLNRQQHSNNGPGRSSPPNGTIGQAIANARIKKQKNVTSNPPLPATPRPSWANGNPAPEDLPSHL